MLSYHRVLKVFGRSVNDKTWNDPTALKSLEERIQKEQNEKNERNEQQLADESTNENPTELFQAANVENTDVEPDYNYEYYKYYHDLSDSNWDSVPLTTTEKDEEPFKFKQRSVYRVRSLGHEIFPKVTLPRSSIQRYTVEINRPDNWAMGRRVRRALKSHGTGRMMHDVVRCGLITQGQLVGHLTGGRFTDTFGKAFQATPGDSSQRQALSNEKI
ncbi:hypothetical protein SI65_05021 [Aspergillus cristatus]|uniref:Uncharacterized protein n=1 Tax=Aspergillus cristatus TaxID=573508 RepID=A0A1E3BGD4_ASPCR|nr:hypothetical protein SI65_05021 [Aspergillus cristatus]